MSDKLLWTHIRIPRNNGIVGVRRFSQVEGINYVIKHLIPVLTFMAEQGIPIRNYVHLDHWTGGLFLMETEAVLLKLMFPEMVFVQDVLVDESVR